MITVKDAAAQKGCTRAALSLAIHRGDIDAEKFGDVWAIIENQKFKDWTPSEKHQGSARARWSTSKAKKARKSA